MSKKAPAPPLEDAVRALFGLFAEDLCDSPPPEEFTKGVLEGLPDPSPAVRIAEYVARAMGLDLGSFLLDVIWAERLAREQIEVAGKPSDLSGLISKLLKRRISPQPLALYSPSVLWWIDSLNAKASFVNHGLDVERAEDGSPIRVAVAVEEDWPVRLPKYLPVNRKRPEGISAAGARRRLRSIGKALANPPVNNYLDPAREIVLGELEKQIQELATRKGSKKAAEAEVARLHGGTRDALVKAIARIKSRKRRAMRTELDLLSKDLGSDAAAVAELARRSGRTDEQIRQATGRRVKDNRRGPRLSKSLT